MFMDSLTQSPAARKGREPPPPPSPPRAAGPVGPSNPIHYGAAASLLLQVCICPFEITGLAMPMTRAFSNLGMSVCVRLDPQNMYVLDPPSSRRSC